MIRLNRAALTRALKSLAPIAVGASGKDGTDPRHAHVLLVAPPSAPYDSVGILAIPNDYTLMGVRYVDAEDDVPPGLRAMIPHRWLSGVAAEMPGDALTLTVDTKRIVASAGRVRMEHDPYADDFPLPEPLANEVERCDFTGKELSDALGEVAYAIPARETWTVRPALAGVLLEDDGPDIRFVATSGRQFAMVYHQKADPDHPDETGAPLWRFTIPAPAVPVLRSFFAPSECVRVRYADTGAAAYATFAGEWGSLRVRLPTEDYPAYRTLVEQPDGESVTADRATLLAAASRAMLAGEAPLNLRWTGDVLEASNDARTYHEQIDAASGGFTIRLSTPALLRAALERTTGELVRLVRRGTSMLYAVGDNTSLHGMSRIRQEGEK